MLGNLPLAQRKGFDFEHVRVNTVQQLENSLIARCCQQCECSEYTSENTPIFVSLNKSK